MTLIWKIALRNLKEHKVKTIIIGVIVTIGIAVLVVGNSLMDTATAGIEKAYIRNYTGNVIITGYHRGNVTLFGVQSMDIDAETPRIPEYQRVLDYVSGIPKVRAYSPQATVGAMVSLGEQGHTYAQAFGIDPERYREMFPDNIQILSGEFLSPGQEGILLGERLARRLAKDIDRPLEPGDKVTMTSMSMVGGIRVREATVRGIFRFTRSNPQLDMVSLIDMENLRALAGLTVEHVTETTLTQAERSLLGDINEDDLFSSAMVEEVTVGTVAFGEDSLLNILGEMGDRDIAATLDSGAWHFLLLRIDDDSQTKKVIADLTKFFKSEGIDAKASEWLSAAGPIAQMAFGVKSVFNVIVLIIAVVAVIIIMNTLVISVTERVPEIGTMRAIGAQKTFIRNMIACETIMVTGAFGLLGIVLGAIILGVLHLTGIEATNPFFEVILGGKVLRPSLSMSSVVLSLVLVMAIGVVSSLYPVSIALRTKPVVAMQDH